MHFNDHSYLEGRHAFLSASDYHWIGYSDEKLDRKYIMHEAAARGTRIHNLAKELILLRIPMADDVPSTLNLYVNDCVGWRMTPEQMLVVSRNAFGTPDAIGFRNNTLRISDLKTGENPGSVHQLEVYAAFFCLEYGVNPFEILIELRIYQYNEAQLWVADPDDIFHIMEKIKSFDVRIEEMRKEAFL